MAGKQKGGTLLGVVLGALLGLSVSLAVAVYITKMPVPFTNKAPQYRTSESDAAEALKNRNWNPNAALAGKNFAKPSPAASAQVAAMDITLPVLSASSPAPASAPVAKSPKVVAITSAQAPIAAVPVAPAVTAASAAAAGPAKAAKMRPAKPVDEDSSQAIPSVAAGPAKSSALAATGVAAPARPAKLSSADPLGDLAQRRAADPMGSLATTQSADLAATASDPFNYFVQAGAFRTPEEAEKQRSRLQALGLQSRVTEREQAGRMVYRVRIGPFDKKDDADRMKTRMESHSLDSALVRVQR